MTHTELPAALEPWAGPLALLAPELALSLGAWLPRLQHAVGPLVGVLDARDDAPNGYGGLARRGPYERLLLAEWLLADAFPEEFTRRAAMGEHGFLQLAFQSPAGSRRCRVLLDAGPDQLGAPRLAHLALLIVLARRAAEASAELHFTAAQTESAIQTELTPATIGGLLEARSLLSLDRERLARGRARLDPDEKRGSRDERWVIGSTAACRLAEAEGWSTIAVSEPLAREASELRVSIRRSGQRAIELGLPLPPPPNVVRLFRDPFAIRSAAAPRPMEKPRVASELVFAAGGRRLFFLDPSGTLVSVGVPNAPGSSGGATWRYHPHPGERILAVGTARGSFRILVARGQDAELRMLNKKGHPFGGSRALQPTAVSGKPRWPDEPRLAALHRVALGQSQGTSDVAVDADGQLVVADAAGRLLALPTMRVLAVAPSQGESVRYLWQSSSSKTVGIDELDVRYPHQASVMTREASGEVRGFLASTGVAAIANADGSWLILSGAEVRTLVPPSGSEVIGITGRGGSSSPLVILEQGRRQISVAGVRGFSTMAQSEKPFERTVVHGDLLACIDASGMLTVTSLSKAVVLLRGFDAAPKRKEPVS